MLKLFLALRYLKKRKIVLLSIAAVALCVCLLIVVTSLFAGFIKAIQRAQAGFEGDITINLSRPVEQYGSLVERLEELEDIEAAAPVFLGGAGLLHLGEGKVVPVYYAGIDPEKGARLAGLQAELLGQKYKAGPPDFEVPGHPDETGAWVGIGLLAQPDEETDSYDLAEAKKQIGRGVVFSTGFRIRDETGTGGDRFKRVTRRLYIADVFFTGHHWYDQTLYLPIDKIGSLLYGADRKPIAHSIWLRAAPGSDPEELIEPVTATFSEFARNQLGWSEQIIEFTRISTSRSNTAALLEPVQQQLDILMLILGVICSVGVVLVFCIFYMVVTTRLKDVAIIKSCGASGREVAAIFLAFAASVGITGGAVGTVLGWVIIRNINVIEDWIRAAFGIKLWQSSIYVFTRIPAQMDFGAVLWIVIAAVGASVLGALLPAIIAARTAPVRLLRYE